jgi:multidrug resistance efflux pump
VIRAGVSGRVEQFLLRVGAVVNPLAFPAGILIPEGAGYRSLQAGFGQIEAQIMKVGMAAEVTCVSKPFTIIPMVVTGVQDYIGAGQFRGGEQLIDAQQVARPDTLLVFSTNAFTKDLFPEPYGAKARASLRARTCQRRRRRSESRLSRF